MPQELLRKVDTDWLLSIYGAMLTEKQRQWAGLYCREDLSLGEIARQEGVSRQCVHETLRRAEKQLHALEDKLHLRQRLDQAQRHLQTAQELLQSLSKEADSRQIIEISAQIEQAISLINEQEDAYGL